MFTSNSVDCLIFFNRNPCGSVFSWKGGYTQMVSFCLDTNYPGFPLVSIYSLQGIACQSLPLPGLLFWTCGITSALQHCCQTIMHPCPTAESCAAQSSVWNCAAYWSNKGKEGSRNSVRVHVCVLVSLCPWSACLLPRVSYP